MDSITKYILEQETNTQCTELNKKIIDWFMKNPSPKDEAVHKFAESLGIDPDEFETNIYKVLSDIIHLGRSKNFKGKYDSKELEIGTKVELEHMPYPCIAEKIAKDHLAEMPDYYTRLKKMEKEGGVEENIQELFIQAGEIQNMPNGSERDLKILRLGIVAELDAVNLYDGLADLASNSDVSKLMKDVSQEEKVHAGEFETLMEELDPSYEQAEDEAEGEVEDLLK